VIVLDTDHLTLLTGVPGKMQDALSSRLRGSGEETAASIVSVEEQLRGWLARINRVQDIHKQIPAYERLAKLFRFYLDWKILVIDARVADIFNELKKQRIHIGSNDLKIASIALAHNALLLSANLRDFRRVPGLRVESWI
jgi:tRNA(fMet)-specific endonuclease VapC